MERFLWQRIVTILLYMLDTSIWIQDRQTQTAGPHFYPILPSLHLLVLSMQPPSMNPSTKYCIATGIGVAVGLAVPPLYRRFVQRSNNSKHNSSSSSKSPSKSSSAGNGGVHAVRDVQDGIRISRQRLEELLTQVFVAVGCPLQGAALTASVLVFADARGIPSHGANRADTYVNEIQAGLVDATAQPFVERSHGACAVIHGNNALGAVVSKFAMETALPLAQEFGIAIVTCHSSNHFGAAGYWAKMALDKNMIGLSFTNTSPIAFPTRAQARGLGTNPFCFFAPSVNEDSFQLDMATTTVPIGKVEVMDRIGKPVPLGWGVDGNGRPCTDAAKICKYGGGLYPLGGPEETAGYKGYGLGMFVEIMCSVLSGAAIGPDGM